MYAVKQTLRNSAPIFLLLVLLPAGGLARFGPNQNRFLSVTGWEGTFEITAEGSGNTPSPIGLGTVSYTIRNRTTASIHLDRYDPDLGGWTGRIQGTVNINERSVLTLGTCTTTVTITGQGSLQSDFEGKPRRFFLTLDLNDDRWSFWPSDASIVLKKKSVLECNGSMTTEHDEFVSWSPLNRSMGLEFPASGLELAGRKQMPDPGTSGHAAIGAPFTHDITWRFRPLASKELELILEPQGYEEWRPEAGANEQTPGNEITVRASLRYSDGSALDTKALAIEFELTDTSHEPGIAMNFPLAANAKKTADLRIDPARNSALMVTGQEQQAAATRPGEYTEASVVISSYDWGGWTKLKVQARTKDGREIKGHLKGDKSAIELPLPKRARDSLIADSWKRSRGVQKPDSDDGESEARGMQGCDGDGLTLYEEYRGFLENGRHIEGNPLKKDFFLLNLVGADAEPGIWLFTEMTGLEVHKDLREDEFFFRDRLVNPNHGRGAHRVDQHGVILVTSEDQDGGETRLFEQMVNPRPKHVAGIRIQPRDAAGRSFSRPFNLSSVDQAQSYDVGIAHELLHSIGVEHHGEADSYVGFRLVRTNDPENTTGAPYFTAEGRAVDVIREDTRQSLARELDAAVARLSSEEGKRAWDSIAAEIGWPQEQAERGWSDSLERARQLRLLIGRPGGQHSGDVGCVMRYMFAGGYPAEGRDDLFYSVPPGSEPLGFSICTAKKGTEVNAPRDPQARYSDAVMGACLHQVCVNDAIPPKKL